MTLFPENENIPTMANKTIPHQELLAVEADFPVAWTPAAYARACIIRMLDLLLAGLGLILAVPFFLVVPVFIKLDSPGSAYFVHRRLGRKGKPFNLVKFRTMRENHDRGRWTVKGDPRITALGRILRKFHIDEVPQLLNVIQGDLSIVGPRPYTREVHEKLCRINPGFAARLEIKPGLTGWAQLAGREDDNPLEYHLHLFMSCDRRYLTAPLTVGTYLTIVVLTVRYLVFEAVSRTF
jgi:lipopolysaccharide/colanic/teichoic acid biosynthesis glycosyltransferase